MKVTLRSEAIHNGGAKSVNAGVIASALGQRAGSTLKCAPSLNPTTRFD